MWYRSSVCRGYCLNVCFALGIPALCWTAVRLYIIYSNLNEKSILICFSFNLTPVRKIPLCCRSPTRLTPTPLQNAPCQIVCQKSSDIFSKSPLTCKYVLVPERQSISAAVSSVSCATSINPNTTNKRLEKKRGCCVDCWRTFRTHV